MNVPLIPVKRRKWLKLIDLHDIVHLLINAVNVLCIPLFCKIDCSYILIMHMKKKGPSYSLCLPLVPLPGSVCLFISSLLLRSSLSLFGIFACLLVSFSIYFLSVCFSLSLSCLFLSLSHTSSLPCPRPNIYMDVKGCFCFCSWKHNGMAWQITSV